MEAKHSLNQQKARRDQRKHKKYLGRVDGVKSFAEDHPEVEKDNLYVLVDKDAMSAEYSGPEDESEKAEWKKRLNVREEQEVFEVQTVNFGSTWVCF